MAFDLVRYIYKGTELPATDEFYQKALTEIEEDGVSSQIYWLLQKHGKLQETPFFFQERLKGNYTSGSYLNLFIKNQMAQLLEAFAQQGMDVIPLKGIYFAEKYFGHFAARPTSDIDLLIRERDIEKACACVKALGFLVEEEMIPGHFHCSFSKALPQSPIPLVVEIHWDILKKQTANLDIGEFWDDALPIGVSEHVKELSPYHTFYLMVLHGWRHNLDSVKYFLDIMEMIHRIPEVLDYDRLLRDARKHQTYKRIVRTLTIVYQQFPDLKKIKKLPCKPVRNYWKDRTVYNLKKYLDFIDYQFFSYDTVKHSLLELGHWCFPSKQDALTQLGVSEKRQNPYLLLFKKRIVSFIKAVFFIF